MYVMVDFICKGLLELWGTRVERKLQNEKFLPTVGFELGIFRLRAEQCAKRADILRALKSLPGKCDKFTYLPAVRGGCSLIICRVFLSYNILIGLLLKQLKSLLTVKSLQNIIHH